MDLTYALIFLVGGFLIGRLSSSKIFNTRDLYSFLSDAFPDKPWLVEDVFQEVFKKMKISRDQQLEFLENHRLTYVTRKLLRGELKIVDGKIVKKNHNDSNS